MAASSNEQAEEYAKNPYAGYIYINKINIYNINSWRRNENGWENKKANK